MCSRTTHILLLFLFLECTKNYSLFSRSFSRCPARHCIICMRRFLLPLFNMCSGCQHDIHVCECASDSLFLSLCRGIDSKESNTEVSMAFHYRSPVFSDYSLCLLFSEQRCNLGLLCDVLILMNKSLCLFSIYLYCRHILQQ